MPLTVFQRELLALLARSRSTDRYLAGGSALHVGPASRRFSEDIDLFHDSMESVAASFAQDRVVLEAAGYGLQVLISQPGFIRARITTGDEATNIDWAHDSAWRFMPLVRDEMGGLILHPVDLAINKVLALAGRDEARDFVDTLYAHEHLLPLGAMVWAAVGKDPGFNPTSLLEQLRRRGRYQPEQFARLDLAEPLDLVEAKTVWRATLREADAFIRSRPHEEAGCLYYSLNRDCCVAPDPDISLADQGLVAHFGAVGGVLPRVGLG